MILCNCFILRPCILYDDICLLAGIVISAAISEKVQIGTYRVRQFYVVLLELKGGVSHENGFYYHHRDGRSYLYDRCIFSSAYPRASHKADPGFVFADVYPSHHRHFFMVNIRSVFEKPAHNISEFYHPYRMSLYSDNEN